MSQNLFLINFISILDSDKSGLVDSRELVISMEMLTN
jgi:hypothetical protein